MFRADLFSRFAREESGLIAVITVIMLPVIMLVMGFVIDMGRATSTKNTLQMTADSSALAGAALIDQTDAVIRAEANAFAESNMPAAGYGDVLVDADIEIGHWDNVARTFTVGGAPQNAVRTTTRQDGDLAMDASGFSAFAGITEWTMRAHAVAVNGPIDNLFCMLALNDDAPESLLVKGDTLITAENCDIKVNSCHDTEAMKVGGTSAVIDMQGAAAESGSISMCGHYTIEGSPTVDESVMYEERYKQDDPFAAVQDIPDDWFDNPSKCTANNYERSLNGGETFTFDLAPTYTDTAYGDVYVMCGGMTIKGNGTFQTMPGTYIIKDGPLLVEGKTVFDGSAGQTLYMTGADGYASFGGQADMKLRGLQLDGSPFEGFAMYGDPDNPATSSHILRGTNDNSLDGIIYLPGAHAHLTGTSGTSFATASDCALFVADTFTIDGTPDLGMKGVCSSLLDADAFVAGDVFLRLVN